MTTTSTQTELLPCPHCNGLPYHELTATEEVVRCIICDASITRKTDNNCAIRKPGAVEAWNLRTPTQSGREEHGFDYLHVREWALSNPRKSANTAFTAGVERNVAYLIEEVAPAWPEESEYGTVVVEQMGKDGKALKIQLPNARFIKQLMGV